MAELPGETSLLFFDTFSHESIEELNLDLIQFPKPVCISEVRIIPLGFRVEVKVPGGARLGATIPSSFKLEIYANNLSHPRAATFQKIGQIDYTENDVQLVVDEYVVTDGLAIKGSYSAVTLAVYGTISRAKVVAELTSSPPPLPPPLPAVSSPPHHLPQAPASPYKSHQADESKGSTIQRLEVPFAAASASVAHSDAGMQTTGLAAHDTASSVQIVQVLKDEDIRRKVKEQDKCSGDGISSELTSAAPASPIDRRDNKRSSSSSPAPCGSEKETDDGPPAKRRDDSLDPLSSSSFDHLTPEHSPTNEQLYMSDQEIGGIGAADDQDQDEIDSEEELLAEDIITTDMTGYIDFDGATDDIAVVSFNPCQCDLTPLCSFFSPVLTQYQIEKQRLHDDADMPEMSTKIMDIVEAFQHADHFSKWIEAVETLPALIPFGLPFLIADMPANSAVLRVLADWTVEGLDLSRAMQQPDATFKVRHLKMGIRMASALFSCDEEISLYLLERGVLEQLLDLLSAECMASSIKLLILRALDTCTYLRCGFEWFMGVHEAQQPQQRYQQQHGEQAARKLTSYQRLLDFVLQKQIARTTVSISALLQKVHVFELLVKFQQTVKRIVMKTMSTAYASKEASSDRNEGATEGSDDDMNVSDDPNADEDQESAASASAASVAGQHSGRSAARSAVTDHVGDMEADAIISCLNEATFVLRTAEISIAQPSRGVPLKTQFEVRYKPNDPFPGVYRMFNSCKLLEGIFVCLSSPVTSAHGGIFFAIRDFLVQLLKSQQGLLYLFHSSETCNGIIRSLIQTGDFEKDNGEGELNPSQQLGLQLIHYLQALQFIDGLKEYWDKDGQECDVDDAEAIAILHTLHIMTFTPVGKDAVVQVLSYDYNLDPLLTFITPTGDELVDSKMKESVCARYTAELLHLVMTYSENVDMLQRFSAKLLEICAQGVASRASGIQEWLLPLKDIPSLGYDYLPSLVSSLKTSAEGLPEISKALVTTLRLLRHLAVPPEQPMATESTTEVKYKYAVVELFSADCLAVFINILQKLADKQLRTWQRGVPDQHSHRDRLLATLKPTLELVKAILTHLVAARTSSEFNDTSCLPALFSVYTVMCSLPPGGVYTDDIVKIQVNVVETLVAFTQAPPSSSGSDRDDLTVSTLWTSMVRELLKYALTSPYTFLSGLMLLSELLPLPLPPARVPPSQRSAADVDLLADPSLASEMASAAVNCRRQWSMHLQPLGSSIEAILKSLAGTSCVHLQHVLRRVCWQLCDLSAGTAMLVCRCLLDALFESMEADRDSKSAASATASATSASMVGSSSVTAANVVPPAPITLSTASVIISCIPEQDTTAKVASSTSSTTSAAVAAAIPSAPPQQESNQATLHGFAGSGCGKLEASSLTSRMLGLISYLVCHPPAKAAFLCMIKSSFDSKTDEKYQQLLPRLFAFLNTVSERHTHAQAQEFIASILQSLCDASISMLPPVPADDENADDGGSGGTALDQQTCGAASLSARDSLRPQVSCAARAVLSAKSQLQQLLSSLPSPREVLVGIAVAFFHHMADQDHGYASILAALRTLVLLAEHDYGFSCIRTALLENPLSLYHLLTRINNTFSKDSSECVSALTMTVELLCLLAFPASASAEPSCKASAGSSGSVGSADAEPPLRPVASSIITAATAAESIRSSWRLPRVLALSPHELRKAVNWQAPVHPLDDLEKLLAEFAVEDSFETVVANIGRLMAVIRSDDAPISNETDDSRLRDVEASFSQEASLLLSEQFIRRNAHITLYSDGYDEKLSAAYWLANQITDDLEIEDTDEKVPCNFEEWCKQYFKDFDLEADIKADNEDIVKAKPKTKYRKSDVFTIGGHGGRRGPYVAPMRARPRGLLRGGGAMGGGGGLYARPNDHFRTRAPNTSRPPSMHVDDFIKLEQGASGGVGDKVPVIGNSPLPVIGGNNDLLRRLDKTNFLPPMMTDIPMLRGRGRGFDRSRGRMRFPTTPANFKPGFPRGFRGGGRGARMNFVPNQRSPVTLQQQPRGGGGGGPPRLGNMSGNNSMPMGGSGGNLLKPYFASPRFNRGGGAPPVPFNKNERRSFSPPQSKINRGDRHVDMRVDRFVKPKGRGGHYQPGPFRDRDAMLMPPPVRSRDRLEKMDSRGLDRNKHHRSYTK